MANNPTETMSISEFKTTCLAVLERVRRTGTTIVITKRGEPVAEVIPPTSATAGDAWLGSMRGTATIVGDVVKPASAPDQWEALAE